MGVSDDKIVILDRVDSTNTYAMNLVRHGGAAHGKAIFAVEQTAGKGRNERKWFTEPGANVQVSIITRMDGFSLNDRFMLSVAAALAVSEVIESCGCKPLVKWPNDVLIGARKAVGILIENSVRGAGWEWAVTGIGLNVNQKKFDSERATSLVLETFREWDVMELTNDIRISLLNHLDRWEKEGPDGLLEAYNTRLFMKGQSVRLKKGNRVFESTIMRVNRVGKLITVDALEHEWDLDEVTIQY